MLTKQFVLAGKAILTAHNNTTGIRYTFKITKKDGQPPAYFVNLLTGPDNENDYTYLGILNQETGDIRLTKASKLNENSQPITAARWTLRQIWRQNQLPTNDVTIQHAGKCCRCCRTLTVPESIETGIGPECRKHMIDA